MARSSHQGAHPEGIPQRQQPTLGGAQGQQQPGWPQQAAPGWPQQGHYAQQGYQQPAQQSYQQPAQQSYQQPVYQPQPAPAQADPLARQGEYHYPQQGQQAAAQHTAPPAEQPRYAPQFDPYVPPSRPTAPPAGATPRHQAHPLQQALAGGRAQQPELRGTTQEHWPAEQPAAPATHAQPQGYAQPQAYQRPPAYQQPQAYQQPEAYQQADAYQQAEAYQQAPAADPRGYDLGHYAPQPHDHGYEPTRAARTATQAAPQEWPQQTHTAADYGHAQHGQHADAYAAAAPQPSLDPAGYHNDQQGGYETGNELTAEHDQEHYDDDEYEEEAPRRSKGLIIVGALVGAIVLGGGLAYAYKTFLAPSQKGKVPIVKNDRAPSKVAPVNPGGKQFANADTKVLNSADNKIGGRLPEPTPMSGRTAASASDADGVRSVRTINVGRDGAIAPPAASGPLNPIPGLVIADSGLRQPVERAAAAPPQPAVVNAPPPARQAPEVKTISLPPPEPPPARVAAAAPPPPSVIDAKTAARAKSVSATPKTPSRVVIGPAPAGIGKGYVAVLSSQRSQMAALQVFADLKAKYPQLLQTRTPGVQEANLGEKGVYHRLLAGPAGSKEDATALCTQLKASGHGSCWITAVK